MEQRDNSVPESSDDQGEREAELVRLRSVDLAWAARATWTRVNMNLTRNELSKLLGVSRVTIDNWEAGKGKTGRNLRALASISGSPSAWLKDGIGKRPVAFRDRMPPPPSKVAPPDEWWEKLPPIDSMEPKHIPTQGKKIVAMPIEAIEQADEGDDSANIVDGEAAPQKQDGKNENNVGKRAEFDSREDRIVQSFLPALQAITSGADWGGSVDDISQAKLVPQISTKQAQEDGASRSRLLTFFLQGAPMSREVVDIWAVPQSVLNRHNTEDYVVDPRKLHVIEIKGVAMKPKLSPGDRVLVDRGMTKIASDGLWAIWNGLEETIRHVEAIPGPGPLRVKVKAHNPEYRTYVEFAENVVAVGKVLCSMIIE